MSRYNLLVINGAVLIGCAVFDFAWRNYLLTGLMLFLPFLDLHWSRPALTVDRKKLFIWIILLTTGLLLIINKPDYASSAATGLLFVALPEEWFFRAYFMRQLQQVSNAPWLANGLTSCLFALLHIPTQGLFGLTVFLPSLFFGWLYQRTNDLVLLVLLHALSNLVFIMFLANYFKGPLINE